MDQQQDILQIENTPNKVSPAPILSMTDPVNAGDFNSLLFSSINIAPDCP